ncbi:RING-H2 finger protein ATL39-like [Miscanthus floridulus]|uniref:RING-H2 finger protein ATL39-like n=1 Tax=Miscanthus floridulus TaxID=154761 RepID=UPI00345A53DF
MATSTGGNPYSNTQQRPSHHFSPFYKVAAAAVVTLSLIALLAKMLHFWLRSLKDAQEADAADDSSGRRAPSDAERRRVRTVGIGSGDGVVAPRQQPPAPAAVAVEMVRAMGPLVCTYLRADGWPAEAACAVCLAELADGDALRVLPVCMHYFHAACVGEWLRAHDTCPLCRAPLAPPAADDTAA